MSSVFSVLQPTSTASFPNRVKSTLLGPQDLPYVPLRGAKYSLASGFTCLFIHSFDWVFISYGNHLAWQNSIQDSLYNSEHEARKSFTEAQSWEGGSDAPPTSACLLESYQERFSLSRPFHLQTANLIYQANHCDPHTNWLIFPMELENWLGG